MGIGVLYISYSGMLEPLGQSQVLAYQERLSVRHPVHLISFERSEDWARADDRQAVAARIFNAGIHWHPLRYHKRFSFLSTTWDILRGSLTGMRIAREHRLAIVHARSYVPSAMALVIKKVTGVKFVFDMRGFWADERVDGGLWLRGGWMYRGAKWFEKRFLLGADHVVSLTHAAVREMRGFDYLEGRMPPMTVIPTCADLSLFVPRLPRPVGFVLGYVGSAGTWYLFDAVVACFAELLKLRPEASLLVINRNEHEYIREKLIAGKVGLERVELRAAPHTDVSAHMARMSAGVFFIKPTYSKQASAPTKLGEFLGCGVPCLSNSGVGDMAGVLEGDHVGVAVNEFDAASLRAGLKRLVALTETRDIQSRCVDAAHRHFALDEGVKRYSEVYRELGQT